MTGKKIIIMVLLLICGFTALSISDEAPIEDNSWEEYKFSFAYLYFDESNYDKFLAYTILNKGNRAFSRRIRTKIFMKISFLKRAPDTDYRLGPFETIFNKMVRETEADQPIDFGNYKKDTRFFFIKTDEKTPGDNLDLPYIWIVKVEKHFDIPPDIDAYSYLENNQAFMDYRGRLIKFLEKVDDYRFYMDENGVIWVVLSLDKNSSE